MILNAVLQKPNRNEENLPAKKPAAPIINLVFLLGFSTLLTQVLLIREANVWLRGNEFIIAAVVAAWLMWTATGSIAGYHLFRSKHPLRSLLTAWCLAISCAVAELIAVRCFWSYTGGVPGESIDLFRSAFLSFTLTALPCLCSGSVFGGAVRWFERTCHSSIARLYMTEALGAVVAGLLLTFVFIPLEHWWWTIAVLAALPLAWYSVSGSSRTVRVCLAAVTLALYFSAYAASPALDSFANTCAGSFLPEDVAVSRDAPRQRLTILTHAGEAAFYHDGQLIGSIDERERAEELSGYAGLAMPDSRNTLIIGFPYNGLLYQLAHHTKTITVLDTEKQSLSLIAPYLLPHDRIMLTSAKVRILPLDYRQYVSEQATMPTGSFDCIIQDVGIPFSYAAVRLFSHEWFSLLSRCLTTNGVCMIVLPGSAGFVPDDLARILARMYITLQTVFPYVTLIPASDTLLIASRQPVPPQDESVWLSRLHSLQRSQGWFNKALLSDNLNPFRIQHYNQACLHFMNSKPDSDRVPRSYGDAMRYSETRFTYGLSSMLARLYDHAKGLMIILAGLAAVLAAGAAGAAAAGWSRIRMLIVMSLCSAAGLIAEMTVVIQVVLQQGSVTYSIGLLFAMFILGLASAAWLVQRFCLHRYVWLLPIVMIVLGCALCISVMLPWPLQPMLVLGYATLLNGINGLCVGACFAVLAQRTAHMRGAGIVLYAADLAGACLGGILFSIIVPPVLGFTFLAVLVSLTLLALIPAAR